MYLLTNKTAPTMNQLVGKSEFMVDQSVPNITPQYWHFIHPTGTSLWQCGHTLVSSFWTLSSMSPSSPYISIK